MGVAVDGSGNVFVADSGNNAVKEIVGRGRLPPRSTPWAADSAPDGVAVDGSGNVFVADLRQQCGEGDRGGGRLHHPSTRWAADSTSPLAWRWTPAATSSSPITATMR